MRGVFQRISLSALIALAVAPSVLAASPTVTAVLSDSEPMVGQTVQLEIKVTGANNAAVPETIPVDGLEIHQTGTSRQFEMHNFDVSSSITYNYTVLPLKAGQFKIPPQTVRVGNDSLRTPELALKVAASSSPSSGARGQTKDASLASKLAFAELIVAKKDAYVGEMIPAEIRLGFDPRAHARLQEGPDLGGQGFTTQKLQQPRESMETIGGRTYQVLNFKTAIAAARPGNFEIGPVQAKVMVMLPRRPSAPRTNRPRSPFDPFDLDDPFSDPFFSDPFGSFGERTELPLKSETAALQVKPLPPNAPASFSGAVGNFTMTVDAKPKSVQVGDPITVTATISGRGSFDRMNGPIIEDERGWHKYPPSSNFKQDDDVGISGTKTFEMVLAPNEKKQNVPPLVFSYFDPIKENYVTVRSEPVPIQVEGGAAPAPAAANTAAASATSSVAPATAPTAAQKPQDILYQLNDLGHTRSFTPLYLRPSFWAAQLGPLLVLLGFIVWKIRQAKIGNRETRRIAALEQESAALLRKLRRSELPAGEYFSDASRTVRLKTALAQNVDPNAVDADLAANAFKLDENSREQLRDLFQRSDELRYSGSGNGDKLSAKDREEVLHLIESLRA